MAHDDDEDRTANRKRRYRRDEDDDAQSGTGAKRAALVAGLLLALVAVGSVAYVAGARSGRSGSAAFGEGLPGAGEWVKAKDYWLRVDGAMRGLGGRGAEVSYTFANKKAGAVTHDDFMDVRAHAITASGRYISAAFGASLMPRELGTDKEFSDRVVLGEAIDRREDFVVVITGGPFGTQGRAFVIGRER